MKLCELQIKNYGCIGEDGVKIKIDDIVVLIGANNVGKSTVLNAYELFQSSGVAQPISSFHENNEDNNIEIVGLFSEMNEHDISQIGSKWVYTHEAYGDVIRYKWIWSKANIKGEKYSWNEEENKWIKGGMGGWDTKIASCIPIPIKINPFDDTTEIEKKIIEILTSAVKETIKTDNGRLADMLGELNTLANDVKTEISTTLDDTTGRVAQNLSDIFPDCKVDIQPEAGKFDADKIIATGSHVVITDSAGNTFPLSNQGSGLQRAFLWSAIESLANSGNLKIGRKVVSESEPRILLVEEPESFLHPPAIRSAREALYKIAKLVNWQVMITTHSPVFIDVSKPHTTIVRVDREQCEVTRTFSTDDANFEADERKRLQMIRACHPTVNEFFFSDRIILVEGDTEQAVLNTLAGECSDTMVVNCYGKGNIPMFQKILNHFKLSYTVIHDLDSPKSKRKDKWIRNSMWTINQRIIEESNNGSGNKVIVNVPDFEGQYFGTLQSGDKPFNALVNIKLPSFSGSDKYNELIDILNNNAKARVITSEEDYNNLAIKHSETLTEKDAWEIS